MTKREIPGWVDELDTNMPPDPATWPPVVTRAYPGSLPQANQAYAFEAGQLARWGFRPTGQTYAQGSHGAGAVLFVLIAAVVGLYLYLPLGIGVIVLAAVWLVAAKPAGSLSVTYQRI